jgi:hypothetical protein
VLRRRRTAAFYGEEEEGERRRLDLVEEERSREKLKSLGFDENVKNTLAFFLKKKTKNNFVFRKPLRTVAPPL